MGRLKKINNFKGQALMIVITIIALLSIIGLAFFSLAQVERLSGLRYLDSLRSRYIAEAGVAYAIEVLRLDRQTNLIDSFEDLTFKNFEGTDLDLDRDEKAESRWFYIVDSQGQAFGRFGVKISDEASKIHLNTSPRQTLEQLFSKLEMDGSKVNALVSGRPFNAVEQIGSILKKKDFARAKDFLTVYSRDAEIDLERKRRAYLNSSSAQVILEAFLTAGITSPYQKAANLKDASDEDLVQTQLDGFVLSNIKPAYLLEAGGWQKTGDFYTAEEGGAAGKFIWSNLSIEDGEYSCFFYGTQETDVIGQVYLDTEEESGELLYSAEALAKKVKVEGGLLRLNIKPAKDKTSYLAHIELVSSSPKGGLLRKTFTGTEALVINELMVKLARQIIASPVVLASGESTSYTFTQIKPGDYYVAVLANTEGGLVGNVNIHGHTADNLYGGAFFPFSVNVSSDGDLTVEVRNNTLGTSSFKGIKVIQQPDCEFIEVLNLSSGEIDLGNFSFEVYSVKNELVPGWPAKIPEGTKIKPYQHLVFSVDNNDSQPCPRLLKGNRISFLRTWGFNSVGLIFGEYAESIDKSFDLLPDIGATVVLKDNLDRRIEAVKYQESQVSDFTSLERADPGAKTDTDGDGLFDGWYKSEAKNQATPASPNENAGMYTPDEDGKPVKHSPSETVVFNRPPSNLREVVQLAAGENWKRFTISDVSLLADRLAYQAIELDLSGRYNSGEFVEKDGAFESANIGDKGEWEFSRIPKGSYLLSILSDRLAGEGQRIQVAYRFDSKIEFKDFSPLLFVQGVALYGNIELKDENSMLQLKIINDSEGKIVLKKIRLEPVNSVQGRININTAKPEVLSSILLSEELTQTILKNRPVGITANRKLGVGELFFLDPSFLNQHEYFTVKSDVYEINCRGEYFPQGKTLAYQNIRTVVRRAE